MSDAPYTPPAASSEAEGDLDDLGKAPAVVTLAGFAQLFTGVSVGVAFFQLYSMLAWDHIGVGLKAVPVTMMAVGAGLVVTGGMLTKAHHWAAKVGLGLAALSAVFTAGWTIYAGLHGLFQMVVPFAGLLGAVSAVLTPMALGPTRKITAARERLQRELAQG